MSSSPEGDFVNSNADASAERVPKETQGEGSRPDTPPSRRELRRISRSIAKSHKHFLDLLSQTTVEFLNNETRNASAVQVSLNQVIGDCDKFIYLLQLRMDKCPNDQPDDREYQIKCLASTKAIRSSVTQAYADRIEELTKETNGRSVPPSVSGSKRSRRHSASRSVTTHKTSSSRRSQKAREARARMEELRVEEEHEEQMQKQREELALRKLQRKKEEIRLKQTIEESQSETSEDSSQSERK